MAHARDIPEQTQPLMRQALRGMRLFASWPDAPMEELLAQCSLRRYGPGDAVPRGGQHQRSVLVVVSGFIELSSPSPQGRRYVITLLGPGEATGLVLLLGTPPLLPIQYRATEATTLVHIPVAALRVVLDSRTDLWRDVAFYALERQRQNVASKHHQAVSEPLRQLAAKLIELLERHGLRALPPEAARELRITHAELAAMLGRSRMTTTTALNTLKQRGLIVTGYGHIAILNTKALTALAD